MQNYTGYGWEGKNYKNDLSTTDIAKLTRQQLKKEFPECKFSVTSEYYSMGSSIHCSLMSAPFKVFPDEISENVLSMPMSDVERNTLQRRLDDSHKEQYLQINHYQFHEFTGLNNGTPITKKAHDCLKTAYQMINSFNYDDSDAQIDYFSTNFYLHLNIGKWNKPFIQLS